MSEVRVWWASQVAPANAGDRRDAGLVPELERSPDIGHGNLLQCTCLGNSMDRGAWRAAESRTWLSAHTRSDDKNVDKDVGQHLVNCKWECVSLVYIFWCCNKNPTITWFNKESFSSYKSPKYRADKSICNTGSFLSTLIGTFILWFHDSYFSVAIMSVYQLIRGKVCFIFLKTWPNFYFTCYWPGLWPMATDSYKKW